MALAMAAKYFTRLRQGVKVFVREDIPSALFCDNTAAIEIAHNPKLNDRLKHIDIAYHFTREKIEESKITLLSIPTEDNLADICTKAMVRAVNDHLCTKIFG
jgi:hypothetical protein